MKNEKLLNAIGEIDDELVLGAVNDIKEKDRRRKDGGSGHEHHRP